MIKINDSAAYFLINSGAIGFCTRATAAPAQIKTYVTRRNINISKPTTLRCLIFMLWKNATQYRQHVGVSPVRRHPNEIREDCQRLRFGSSGITREPLEERSLFQPSVEEHCLTEDGQAVARWLRRLATQTSREFCKTEPVKVVCIHD